MAMQNINKFICSFRHLTPHVETREWTQKSDAMLENGNCEKKWWQFLFFLSLLCLCRLGNVNICWANLSTAPLLPSAYGIYFPIFALPHHQTRDHEKDTQSKTKKKGSNVEEDTWSYILSRRLWIFVNRVVKCREERNVWCMWDLRMHFDLWVDVNYLIGSASNSMEIATRIEI